MQCIKFIEQTTFVTGVRTGCYIDDRSNVSSYLRNDPVRHENAIPLAAGPESVR